MIANDFSFLYCDIKSKTTASLAGSKSEESICKMMRDIFASAEKASVNHLTAEERAAMDCAAGCSTCCRVNVAVLEPEAIAIKNYLINNMGDRELADLIERMETLVKDIMFLSDEERLFAGKECAFLNEKGACGIYPVRPFLCRSVTSASSESCKEAMTMIALGEHVPIPMNLKQKEIMDTAFMALAEALGEYEIDTNSGELTARVLKYLQSYI